MNLERFRSVAAEGLLQPDDAQSASPPDAEGGGLYTAPSIFSQSRAMVDHQIHLQLEQGQLYLSLPTALATSADWVALWPQLKQRLAASQRSWPPQTPVTLMAGDLLLDHRQLHQLATVLAEANLQLQRLQTSRRQTAIAAVTAGYSVEQQAPTLALTQVPLPKYKPPQAAGQATLAEPLYVQTTLRSGAEIHHGGTVIILGDLNPGSSVVADGDIFVWGRLRGIAHAGASGDPHCRIMALQMNPTQLRIADRVARAPEVAPAQWHPEVAYIGVDGIEIVRAADLDRNQKSP